MLRSPQGSRVDAEHPDGPLDDFSSGAPSLSVTMLLAILRLYGRQILLTGLVTFVLAAGLAFALPLTYTATASFVPPGANSSSSAAALMGQLAGMSGASSLLGGKSQGDLYVGILKSHVIARELVERFDLMRTYKVKKESKAEKELASKSLFEEGSKDPIVTIRVTDKSPERARDLAQGYLDALQKTSAGLALTESSQRRQFYEQRLAKEKDDLANAEVALKQDEEKTGLIAPAGQTATSIQALAQTHAQIVELQTHLASLLHYDSEENPEVLRTQDEIKSLQSQVTQMEEGQSKGDFGHFSTAQVPALQLEYIRRARDVKYHETLFDIIAKQYEAARLDEAKDAPLQVLDRPVIPDTKSGPPRLIIAAIGLVLGLLGSSAWALLKTARESEA